MNVFDKRPLSLILCIFLSGFVIFSGIPLVLSVILVSIFATVALVLIFSPIKLYIKRATVIALSTALLISFLISTLYFNLYFNLYTRYEDTEECEIIATVTSVNERSYGYSTELLTHSINGEKTKRKVIAYIEKDLTQDIKEYSAITLVGRIADIENSSDFDSRGYYRARGFSAEIVDLSSCTVSGNSVGGLERWISERRDSVASYITSITGEVGGGLLVALLLGERDHLSGLTRHAFTRLGATHTLAISGMHLVILMYGVNRLLLALRVRKKARKIAEIILCIAYTALTGFPVSVVRASIMLIISDILFLLASKSDSVTSLFISVSLICLAAPYSIYDISLWLSALSTFGLLVYVEMSEKRNDSSNRLLARIYRLLSPIIISVFAITATVLISNLSFGSISVVAIVFSPIVTLLTEGYMYLGIVAILLGGAAGLGKLVEAVGEMIIRLVSLFSSINGIYVAADYTIVTVVAVALTLLAVLFLFVKIKRKRNYLLVLLSCFVLINAIPFGLNAYTKGDEKIYYECNGTNELIYISTDNESTVIDISSATSTSTYDLIDSVKSLKLRELDNLIYTGYSPSISTSASKLCSNIYVDSIYLPLPKVERERALARELIDSFEYSTTHLVFYDIGDFFELGEVMMYPAYRDLADGKVAFCLISEDDAITYLSSGMLDDKTRAVALPLLEGCKTLILGRHGARYYGEKLVHIYPEIKRIILGSTNFAIPQDILEYYKNTEIVYYPQAYEIKR
ncbi:MAG: ComEC/Rec2 family competence protein [Clostridia bacterium]|nr:ComEC/Rec2 family competence protein [Clostridia bacterium]